jgi:hypothetical protein
MDILTALPALGHQRDGNSERLMRLAAEYWRGWSRSLSTVRGSRPDLGLIRGELAGVGWKCDDES